VIDCSTTPLLTCFNATRWLPAKMYFVQLYGGATPGTFIELADIDRGDAADGLLHPPAVPVVDDRRREAVPADGRRPILIES
jgi:hypothetical protein